LLEETIEIDRLINGGNGVGKKEVELNIKN